MMSSKWTDDLIDSTPKHGVKTLTKGSNKGSRNAAVLAKIIATLMDSA